MTAKRPNHEDNQYKAVGSPQDSLKAIAPPDSKKPPEGGSLGLIGTPAKADTPSIPDELDEILRKLITELNNINKKPVSREAVIEGYQSVESAKARIAAHIRGARLSTLKRFSHVPPPHDEEWSPEFQKGVEHGVRISQEKLRFEIQRLKKAALQKEADNE